MMKKKQIYELYYDIAEKLIEKNYINIINIYDNYSHIFVDIFVNKNFTNINENSDDNILDIYALYNHCITSNYIQAKKYYLIAIKKGNINAMNNLSSYYRLIEQDYDKMKEYCLMAIERGNINAMNNLGLYYSYYYNYDKMEKCYLIAIEEGNISAMYNLGLYYYNKCIDSKKMEKYFLMAIEKGNKRSMKKLSLFYRHSPLKLYILLINIKNKNSLINEKIDELLCYDSVKIYDKKIK